jgi:hypothetical protein
MIRSLALLALTFAAVMNCSSAAESLVTSEFLVTGINRVILRASSAEQASVIERDSLPVSVVISGTPSGGAKGYHSADPNWRETPASEWGLAFVAQRFGNTLVVSSKSEIQYIHHRYTIEGIKIEVPPTVEVLRERRVLDGNGEPNLAYP